MTSWKNLINAEINFTKKDRDSKNRESDSSTYVIDFKNLRRKSIFD